MAAGHTMGTRTQTLDAYTHQVYACAGYVQ
jgi:hypothetical protein